MGKAPEKFDSFIFREEVRDWLTAQDRQACVLFSARFALRSVPSLSYGAQYNQPIKKSASDIILPSFWAIGSTLSASNRSGKTQRAFSAFDLSDSVIFATATYATITDGARAADAAAAAAIAAVTNGAASYAAYCQDKNWVEDRPAGTPITDLTHQPLWPNTDMPPDLETQWQDLKTNLLGLDQDWDVWTNWYEDRLAGKPLNKALELAIINLDPDEYWKKGAGVTNARIRELVAEHSVKSGPDMILKAVMDALEGPPFKLKQVNKPKFYEKSDFDDVIKRLEQYKSVETWEQGDNQEPISLSPEELIILKHSLAIAATASDIPNWSNWMVTQLKGVLAVMEAFTPIIKKLTGPLPKLWNGVLKKLQKALAGMEVEEAKTTEDE